MADENQPPDQPTNDQPVNDQSIQSDNPPQAVAPQLPMVVPCYFAQQQAAQQFPSLMVQGGPAYQQYGVPFNTLMLCVNQAQVQAEPTIETPMQRQYPQPQMQYPVPTILPPTVPNFNMYSMLISIIFPAAMPPQAVPPTQPTLPGQAERVGGPVPDAVMQYQANIPHMMMGNMLMPQMFVPPMFMPPMMVMPPMVAQQAPLGQAQFGAAQAAPQQAPLLTATLPTTVHQPATPPQTLIMPQPQLFPMMYPQMIYPQQLFPMMYPMIWPRPW